MIAGSYAYSVRHPFGCVVSADGHYRETRAGAIGEVAINLLLSLVLENLWGWLVLRWEPLLRCLSARSILSGIYRSTFYIALYGNFC